MDEALSSPIAFVFDPAFDELAAFWLGWPRTLTYIPGSKKGTLRYEVEMMPLDWRSALFKRSRVFQDMTVPDIVSAVSKDAGHEGTMQLAGKYPVREYTVQHEETDLDFMQRLLEHEGIFHFFHHTRNQRVFADDNAIFAPEEGHEFVKWVPQLGDVYGLTDLRWEHRIVPSHVALRDYDWRSPGSIVQSDRKVEAHGYGIHVLFGEHVKTDDAKRLAAVRAQELGFPHQVIHARSNIRLLRPGHKFTLEAPASLGPGLDGAELVVASVRHDVVQGTMDGSRGDRAYTNELVLFPLSVPFRPARVTPKPRIDGLVYAVVDGETRSTAAPIDDQGRYRLFFPFDTNAKAGGKASRWVRMAQGYAGAGYGMHMPLHIGTQVVVAHVNGDPDRPVIVGAIPNADTVSPVHSANATQSAIRSHGGILFELEDDA